MNTKIKCSVICIFLYLSLTCSIAFSMESNSSRKAIAVPLQEFISNNATKWAKVKNAIANGPGILWSKPTIVGCIIADLGKDMIPGYESEIVKMGENANEQNLSPSNVVYQVCTKLKERNYGNLFSYIRQAIDITTLTRVR